MNFASEVSAFWACLTLGLTFVTQRAWQVLANVQRPSAAFASLSRRDNAWQNPRRPALVAIEGGLLHGCANSMLLAASGANTKWSLTLTSEICRCILSPSINRHTGGPAPRRDGTGRCPLLAQSRHDRVHRTYLLWGE